MELKRKLDTSLEFLFKRRGKWNSAAAWDYIKPGQEYWFRNHDAGWGPLGWMKIRITYKRSGVYFYKVVDKNYIGNYIGEREEQYADVDCVFTQWLHPVEFPNPAPEYFTPDNFDTLGGRVKIV